MQVNTGSITTVERLVWWKLSGRITKRVKWTSSNKTKVDISFWVLLVLLWSGTTFNHKQWGDDNWETCTDTMTTSNNVADKDKFWCRIVEHRHVIEDEARPNSGGGNHHNRTVRSCLFLIVAAHFLNLNSGLAHTIIHYAPHPPYTCAAASTGQHQHHQRCDPTLPLASPTWVEYFYFLFWCQFWLRWRLTPNLPGLSRTTLSALILIGANICSLPLGSIKTVEVKMKQTNVTEEWLIVIVVVEVLLLEDHRG